MRKSALWGLSLLTTVHVLGDPVVGAYYENWSQYRPPSGGRSTFFPNMIDPSILTDLYYAFAIFGYVTQSIDPTDPHLTGDYTVQPVEWNDQSVLYPQVQALKQQNPNLRTLLSIGGWGFNDPQDPSDIGTHTYKLYSQMVANSVYRNQFITSAISYATRYGFNGIDIDWEYPGDLTRGGAPEDFVNFIEFLKEFYAACKNASPTLLLTYAAPAIVPSGVPQNYHDNPGTYFQWLAQCAQYVDRLNIMAYDYHGPFDRPQITGVNAPLNQDTNPQSTLYVVATIKNYIENGVPAEKMVLGTPIYGHTFGGVSSLTPSDNGPGKPFTGPGNPGPSTQSPGLLAYYEIADALSQKQLVFATDALTSTAYSFAISPQQWVSFDTPETIALKAQTAKNFGLLGVMAWAIDDDEYAWGAKYPNMRSLYQHFLNKE